MKTKKTKKIATSLFIGLIFFCNSVFSQTSVFNIASDTVAANMTSDQLTNYRILLHNEHYNSFKVITSHDISEVVDSSRLTIALPFFEDTNLVFTASSFVYEDDDNYTWVGVYTGDTTTNVGHGAVTIVRKEGRYIGHLNLDNSSYELFDLSGGLQLFCQSVLLGQVSCGEPNENNNDSISGSKPGDNPCKNLTTRVLVLYSTQTLESTTDINGTAALAVSQINTIWSNSNINNTMILASVQQISFTKNALVATDLANLASNTTIQTLRNTHKADLIVFLIKDGYSISQGVIEGAAHTIDAFASQAYAIVQVNAATNGLYVFAHEVAHLYGARHSPDADNNSSNGHGHIFGTQCFANTNLFCNNTRRTTMATVATGESRIEHFSNPDISFQSKPTGTSGKNNAYQILERMERVANFYADAIPKYGWMEALKFGCNSPTFYKVTICDDPDLFTYSWFYSANGTSWSSVGSNSSTYSHYGNTYRYIKCIVSFGNNRFYVLQIGAGGCSYAKFTITFPIENLSGGSGPDNSGRSSIASAIDASSLNENNIFSIFPSPSSGDFSLEFTNHSNSNLKIIISDYTGRDIEIIEPLGVKDGLNSIKIQPKNKLAKGLYFVRMEGQEKMQVKRLLID